MSYMLIAFVKIAALFAVFIIFDLIMGVRGKRLVKDIITLAAIILIMILVRFIYKVAVVMTVSETVEFYIAFIGGGLTLIAYNAMNKPKRIDR